MPTRKDLQAIVNGSVRSIAASFPIFSSFAQAWNEYETHTKFARVEEFLQILTKEIISLKVQIEAIVKDGYPLNDFPHLLEQTIYKIQREYSNKKRDLFARLLAKSIAIGPDLTLDNKTTFVETLDSLTEYDLSILSNFKPKKTLRANDIIVENNEKVASQQIMSLSKLESRGLISETDHSDYNGSSAIGGAGSQGYWLNRWRHKYFVLLPIGESFYEIIF